MTGKAFTDTNILLYLHDPAAGKKRDVAFALYRELLSDGRLSVSTQVLGEFYTNATRFRRDREPLMPAADAQRILTLLAEGSCYTNTPADYVRATDVAERHKISFWDALIVVAASRSGAEVLLTEDMNHGQTIEGVRIENPFK